MGKSYVVTIAGDTSLGDWYLRRGSKRKVLEKLETEPDSFMKGVLSLVQGSDQLVINLETVLEVDPPLFHEGKQYPNWDNPDRTLNTLKNIGVTVAALANNHTMDFGPEHLMKTIDRLKEEGIKAIGAGENALEALIPYSFTIEGEIRQQNVYLFSCMRASKRYRESYQFMAEEKKPGVNFLNVNIIEEYINSIRKKDPEAVIIIMPHWQGIDYKWASMHERIRKTCSNLMEAGADYIIGHGPHVLNHVENINGGLVVYSIGNFVFNSSGRYSKMAAPPYSAVARICFEETDDGWKHECRLYPIITDNRVTNYATRLLIKSECKELLQILNDTGKGILPVNTNADILLEQDQKGFYFKSELHENKLNDASTYDSIISEFSAYAGKKSNVFQKTSFSTAKLLSEAFRERGAETTIEGNFLFVSLDGKKIVFLESESTHTSLVGYRIIKNKTMARKLMTKKGITVCKGKSFKQTDKEAAWNFAKTVGMCVVKPSDGHRGEGVTVGIRDKQRFDYAWKEAVSVTKKEILVEEQFVGGSEARYLVIGGKCVTVTKKIPPILMGNGKDTIKSLIDKQNREKKKNPYLKNHLIYVNHHREAIMEEQGYYLDSVPEKGKCVLVDWKSSISTGGNTLSMDDVVHPGFKKVAEDAAAIVPGLDIIGVDILAHDHTAMPQPHNYTVIEANTRPALGPHQYPAFGKSVDTASMVVDYVFSHRIL